MGEPNVQQTELLARNEVPTQLYMYTTNPEKSLNSFFICSEALGKDN